MPSEKNERPPLRVWGHLTLPFPLPKQRTHTHEEEEMTATEPPKKASSTSAVDSDKLWRDRIRQELQHQRTWFEEYGFMVADGSKGVSTAAASLSPDQLDGLKKQMRGAHLQSTQRASYQQRKSAELYQTGDHNRKKFRDE